MTLQPQDMLRVMAATGLDARFPAADLAALHRDVAQIRAQRDRARADARRAADLLERAQSRVLIVVVNAFLAGVLAGGFALRAIAAPLFGG